jgi:Tfp pilus assembly protein PilX
MIPALLAVIVAFSVMGTAIVEVTLTNFTIVGNIVKSQQAFNVAEAGLNYYMWHLNHNATDYKDGQSTPTTPDATLGYGPYTHTYTDTNGVNQGTYTLWINPSSNGSTVVTVRSIGQAAGTSIKRTVQAQIGSPSFASYAVASDSALWFGNTETADGPVASNQGVRMDGPSNSTVSSANATYTPSFAVGGDGSSHPGVWCNTSVTSPVNCNTRSKSAWVYPVPQIDFNQVSSSLCTMKKVAFANYSATSSLASQSNACSQTPGTRTNAYVPQLSSSFSTTKGYLIKLNSNNTYDLLKVNSENDRLTPYTSALGTTTVASGINLPSSGVLFVEDNVWVLTPTNFNGRLTIASGRLATSNSTDIVIAGPLLYAAKNGTDALGLVAEQSIFIAPYAPPSNSSFNYEVDGALLAENGEVQYGENGDSASAPASYRSSTSNCARGWTNSNQAMTFYGSVATRQTWTWSWLVGGSPCGDAAFDSTGGNGYITGFKNDTTQYDYNLQYAPPPSYPLTSGYNILSWREILTHP